MSSATPATCPVLCSHRRAVAIVWDSAGLVLKRGGTERVSCCRVMVTVIVWANDCRVKKGEERGPGGPERTMKLSSQLPHKAGLGVSTRTPVPTVRADRARRQFGERWERQLVSG